jgi:ribosomal protein S18 acetylase RimI-like enzyme
MVGRLPDAIREATVADGPALATLFIDTWRDEYAGHLPEAVGERSFSESEANWRRTLERSDDTIVLVAGERRLEGLIVGVGPSGDWPGAAEVTLLKVARSSRRCGLGAALMRASAARLSRKGAAALIVRVLEVNTGARRFYETLGGRLMSEARTVHESGVAFAELAYLWADVRCLTDLG